MRESPKWCSFFQPIKHQMWLSRMAKKKNGRCKFLDDSKLAFFIKRWFLPRWWLDWSLRHPLEWREFGLGGLVPSTSIEWFPRWCLTICGEACSSGRLQRRKLQLLVFSSCHWVIPLVAKSAFLLSLSLKQNCFMLMADESNFFLNDHFSQVKATTKVGYWFRSK